MDSDRPKSRSLNSCTDESSEEKPSNDFLRSHHDTLSFSAVHPVPVVFPAIEGIPARADLVEGVSGGRGETGVVIGIGVPRGGGAVPLALLHTHGVFHFGGD